MSQSSNAPIQDPVYAWTANGRRLHVDLADARAHELVAADGDLNPLSMALWQHALAAHAWDVVVDVGVNYGEMLIGVDLPPAARVIGFEPNPHIRALVARSLADAGLTCDLRAEALAERAGTARFEVDTSWSGLSSLAGAALAPDSGRRTIEVAVVRLDDAVPADAASLCVKVDVEGFEQQVLAGARNCRRPDRAWVMMIETLHMPPGQARRLLGSDAAFLLRLADRAVVEVAPGELDSALASGEYYAQDALLAGPAARPLLAATGHQPSPAGTRDGSPG